MNLNDTITAISTALTESAISVIRISGADAFAVTEKIFFKKTHPLNKAHRMSKKTFSTIEVNSHTIHFGYIYDGEELIDEVLISIFKKPNSYTGEDIVEISSHGGVLNTRKILSLILSKGVRHAEPGEFTKRAFLNGRLDLSQAEAVADLIKSKTEDAHKSSIAQLEGSLSEFISGVRKDLVNVISLVELELDFAEEDIEFVKKEELRKKIIELKEKFLQIISTYIAGKVIRDGINLVIAGRPNSGKSSLFNFLLSSDRAIVSNIPGTTRDYIQENIVINGILFNLIDTAGLRFSYDELETEGVRRTYERIKEADLILYLIDSTGSEEEIKESLDYYKKEFNPEKSILCFSKSDLSPNHPIIQSFNHSIIQSLSISIYQLSTIENLKNKMTEKFRYSVNLDKKGLLVLTNTRHKICLEKIIESLEKSIESIDKGMSGEFISLDLRNAIQSLGEITGEFTNDEILNHIFENFCIGK
ncbi:MAG: tRNA uridine-5-carboxymethylaminomethyl(34) synthesis GTPase MnmE [Ignavibacteria bacterium]|nr:tRNA uridine-5-carboxymethylaminomethyl(34) synthesis GTPase MnmE [Ignavibacteria bacterium]